MPKSKSLSRTAWNKLTSKQKFQRKLSLEVLRLMRKGESFAFATKKSEISKFLARKNLKTNLFKKAGRWLPTKTDSIQRSMQFYEKGKGIVSIIIKGSREASKIGAYFSAVGKALRKGDKSDLRKFRGKSITDVNGKKHKFETDVGKLFEIEEQIENPEFREIYSGGEDE